MGPLRMLHYAVENMAFANHEELQAIQKSSIDDKIDPFHYFSLIKFGIGRCIYAAQEVRNDKITRMRRLFSKKYDMEFRIKYFKEFHRSETPSQ